MRYWKKYKEKRGISTPLDKKVGMVVATYKQTHCLEALLRSFQAQTYTNFVIRVVHDGPWDPGHILDLQFKFGSDKRFEFMNTPERKNEFGHNCRSFGFSEWACEVYDEENEDEYGLPTEHPEWYTGPDFIGTCNGDVYYAPVFFEWMVSNLSKGDTVFSYCDMIHSHTIWQPMKTELKRGKIDVGCWMADKLIVLPNNHWEKDFAADWKFIEVMTKGLQPREIAKVDAYLYVHN